MPMHYPPLANGSYRYGDPDAPLPSAEPGPDPRNAVHPTPAPFVAPPAARSAVAEFGPAVSRAPGAGSRKRWIGAVFVFVIAALGVVLLGRSVGSQLSAPSSGYTRSSAVPIPAIPEVPQPRTPGVFSVPGSLEIESTAREPLSGSPSGCALPSTLSDLGDGASIVLLDPTGKPLSTGTLAYRSGTPTSCTFSFSFPSVAAGQRYYVLSLPYRGKLTYSEAELRSGIAVSLGG